MNKQKHKHQIDVQTDEEIVTVTIGADGGVPGGFAKLFNRVVDSEAWARLSDAGRAAYIPLVRFADHRNQFRVQIGRAKLMKYTGLSLSSIKRAIKDLVANKLVVLIERGGVNESNENESNVFQLLVPAEPRMGTGAGSIANPPSVRQRTPSRTPAEPPVGPLAIPPAAPVRTPQSGQTAEPPGFANGPLLISKNKEDSKTAVAPRIAIQPASSVDRAAVLLEEKGVDSVVARQLAAEYPYDRVVDVVATMEWKRRGKCANPGGFIRDALVRQWQTPTAVVDARAKADARLRAEAAEQQARAAQHREHAAVDQEEAGIDRLIASLDDDELAILAQSVLEKYQGNAAVTRVLTNKPPRQCRLMKMEIAGMMKQGVGE